MGESAIRENRSRVFAFRSGIRVCDRPQHPMLRAPTDAVLKTWRLRFSANCLRSRVRGRSRASVERRREDCDSPRKSTSACGRSAPPSSAGSTAPTTSASQRTSPCARRRRRTCAVGPTLAVIIEKLSCASRILVTCCIIGCIAEFYTGISSASRLGHKRGHISHMPLNYMHFLRRYTFPAQWLYGLLRALPGERLFCHRRP